VPAQLRSLDYLPVIELFPDPARPQLLARLTLGEAEPMTGHERTLLEALPHRHTHRGPGTPTRCPTGLVPGLQHDALAEGAQLVLIDQALAYHKLADLARTASHQQNGPYFSVAGQQRRGARLVAYHLVRTGG
jgi:hypothetical protein